ncbi:hypothetical protein RCKICKAPOO_53 [Rhodobacter phage RcKickapoo]|nr:hypothetical protein RCKICKAPOO_53 [Rhodobacter phage RcKickapoo]
MSVSSFLEILQISENQAAKAAAVNLALSQLEAALAGGYTLDVSTLGATVTLGYDTTNDLSPRAALRFMYLQLQGTPGTAFTVVHPLNPHMFFVFNNTTKKSTFKAGATGTGTTVDVPAGMRRLLYCDGTNFIDLGGALDLSTVTARENYNVAFFATPTANEVVATFVAPYDGVFPADFAGSSGKAITPPTTFNRDFVVKKNGTTFGTITCASSTGIVTMETTGHAAVPVSIGDIITVQFDETDAYGISGIILNLIQTHTVTQT